MRAGGRRAMLSDRQLLPYCKGRNRSEIRGIIDGRGAALHLYLRGLGRGPVFLFLSVNGTHV